MDRPGGGVPSTCPCPCPCPCPHTGWFYVYLTQTRVIREEGASIEKNVSKDPAVSIFSISDQGEGAQPIVGDTTPGLVPSAFNDMEVQAE